MAEDNFAVYFPELDENCPDQSGYLWVQKLGSGEEGTVDLVRRVKDGQLFARKKHLPDSPAHDDFHCREVHFNRDHPRIPKIISSHHYKVLKAEHAKVDRVKSTVMISKYCNGGTFERFGKWCQPRRIGGHKMEESVLWRLFADQLDVTIFLHSQTPALTCTDSHYQNTWLHFPDESSKTPVFFSGDLGKLDESPPNIWQPANAGEPGQLRSWDSFSGIEEEWRPYVQRLANDLQFICDNIEWVSRVVDEPESPESSPVSRNSSEDSWEQHKEQWSHTLVACKDELSQIVSDLTDFADQNYGDEQFEVDNPYEYRPETYNKIHELRLRVAAHAAQWAEAYGDKVDYRWARNDANQPFLWADRDLLLSDCKSCKMRGPFKIVNVNPNTWEILETYDTEYGAHNPLNGYNISGGGRLTQEDFVRDPLSEQVIFDGYFDDGGPREYSDYEPSKTSEEEIEEEEEEEEEKKKKKKKKKKRWRRRWRRRSSRARLRGLPSQ